MSDLNVLIRYLRNAIAHCNIEFLPDGQGHVGILKVWNETKRKERTWEAELTVEDLRKLVEKFAKDLIDTGKLTR